MVRSSRAGAVVLVVAFTCTGCRSIGDFAAVGAALSALGTTMHAVSHIAEAEQRARDAAEQAARDKRMEEAQRRYEEAQRRYEEAQRRYEEAQRRHEEAERRGCSGGGARPGQDAGVVVTAPAGAPAAVMSWGVADAMGAGEDSSVYDEPDAARPAPAPALRTAGSTIYDGW